MLNKLPLFIFILFTLALFNSFLYPTINSDGDYVYEDEFVWAKCFVKHEKWNSILIHKVNKDTQIQQGFVAYCNVYITDSNSQTTNKIGSIKKDELDFVNKKLRLKRLSNTIF